LLTHGKPDPEGLFSVDICLVGTIRMANDAKLPDEIVDFLRKNLALRFDLLEK